MLLSTPTVPVSQSNLQREECDSPSGMSIVREFKGRRISRCGIFVGSNPRCGQAISVSSRPSLTFV